MGGVVLIAGVLGVLASWRRLIWIARVRRRNQENDGIADTSRLSEIATGSTKSLFQFSLRTLLLWVMAAGVIADVSVSAWKDARDPMRYGRHLDGLTAWADRIVVRAGGFNCCGPVDDQEVLFEVMDPDELAEVRAHLQFVPGEPSGGCLCCGFPGMDWYRGKTRIALTSIQHGFALRWTGFPGDAHFTEESAQWLRQWFERHGLSEEKLNSLERAQYLR
jgi:hypothetical protein